MLLRRKTPLRGQIALWGNRGSREDAIVTHNNLSIVNVPVWSPLYDQSPCHVGAPAWPFENEVDSGLGERRQYLDHFVLPQQATLRCCPLVILVRFGAGSIRFSPRQADSEFPP